MPVAAFAVELTEDERAEFAPRFWERVQILDPDECWEWMALRSDRGYGRCRFKGRTYKAPRLAYALAVGSIPDGLTIDHLCSNPPCVNPAHLELVTASENHLRAHRKRTHCKHGHELTPENTYTRPGHQNRRCLTCHNAQSVVRAQAKRDRERAVRQPRPVTEMRVLTQTGNVIHIPDLEYRFIRRTMCGREWIAISGTTDVGPACSNCEKWAPWKPGVAG